MWPFIVIDLRTKLQLNNFTQQERKQQAETQKPDGSANTMEQEQRCSDSRIPEVPCPGKHLRKLGNKVSAKVCKEGTARNKSSMHRSSALSSLGNR